MKAIIITEFGGPDVLQIQKRDKPSITADQVLIEVYASGINRPDLFQRKGHYPAPAGWVQDIAGIEVAGIVAAIGPDVTEWKVGDRVAALLAAGGYAAFAVAPEGQCFLIPERLSFEEAACLPETLFTVWHNVFQRANLQAEEHILIHGGAGGIGSTAIQLAHSFGAHVYTTAGSAQKCKYCLDLGASMAINYKKDDFETILKNTPLDVILDSIGGDYFIKNINLLQEEGRLLYINATAGANVQLPITTLMQKRLTITGSTLRARSYTFKKKLRDEIVLHVIPLIEQSLFKAQVYQVFDYKEVVQAHTILEKNDFVGKLVLKWK